MLEDLNKINWLQLHHAYGEASDVPILIRSLLSQDKDEREKTLRELFGNIWHQGTIWEASSYAVPFLYELLKLPETPDKLSVAFLLANLATGTHSYYGVLENNKQEETWRRILAKEAKNLEDEVAKTIKHEEATRSAIRKEFNLLYPYLFCEEPVIRDSVAKAFGQYPEFKIETLPLLKNALASENDEYSKETMENSIKVLSEYDRICP